MVFLTYPPPGPYQSVCVPCSAWFLSLHSQRKCTEIVFSNFRSQIGLLLIWPQGALGSLNPTWNRIFFFSIFYPVAENEVTHLYCFNSFLVPLVNIFFCLSLLWVTVVTVQWLSHIRLCGPEGCGMPGSLSSVSQSVLLPYNLCVNDWMHDVNVTLIILIFTFAAWGLWYYGRESGSCTLNIYWYFKSETSRLYLKDL